jgi:hypothetical protein
LTDRWQLRLILVEILDRTTERQEPEFQTLELWLEAIDSSEYNLEICIWEKEVDWDVVLDIDGKFPSPNSVDCSNRFGTTKEGLIQSSAVLSQK